MAEGGEPEGVKDRAHPHGHAAGLSDKPKLPEPNPATSEPLVSQSLFPYLDLDKVDQLALEDRLIKETQKIKSHFYRLTKSLIETLEESQVPLQEIKDFILSSLDQFTSTDTGVEVLDKADKNRIKAARNVSEVFTTLENYTSFFNYHFIEHIIDQFGTDLDQERLENYLEEFHNFCKRNIFEIPCNVFAESSRATAKVFALKCTDEVATMNDVVAITKEIAETLDIPPEALQLCSIKKGCVELHFLISAAVADHIFPVSPSQHSALSEIGVKVFSYNGTGFDCTQPQKKRIVLPDVEEISLPSLSQTPSCSINTLITVSC